MAYATSLRHVGAHHDGRDRAERRLRRRRCPCTCRPAPPPWRSTARLPTSASIAAPVTGTMRVRHEFAASCRIVFGCPATNTNASILFSHSAGDISTNLISTRALEVAVLHAHRAHREIHRRARARTRRADAHALAFAGRRTSAMFASSRVITVRSSGYTLNSARSFGCGLPLNGPFALRAAYCVSLCAMPSVDVAAQHAADVRDRAFRRLHRAAQLVHLARDVDHAADRAAERVVDAHHARGADRDRSAACANGGTASAAASTRAGASLDAISVAANRKGRREAGPPLLLLLQLVRYADSRRASRSRSLSERRRTLGAELREQRVVLAQLALPLRALDAHHVREARGVERRAPTS